MYTISLRCLTAASCFAMAMLAAPVDASAQEATRDYYVDTRGRQFDQSRVYESWFGSARYEPNYLRAAAANAAIFAIELATYWYEPNSSVVDWQYPNLQEKLSSSEAFRFDDNLLRTNYLLHPFAGGGHYLFTRTSGFGVAPSFAAAAAGSAIYELLLEWRELVSINDLIVTPLGGTAAGEFFHQLGNYVNSEQPAVRYEVRRELGQVARDGSAIAFGFARAMSDGWDDPPEPHRVAPDNLGLSSAYAHDFRILAGEDSVFHRGDELGGRIAVRGEFEIAAMPGFLRPGRFSRWYSNGNFTTFDLRVARGGAGHATSVAFDSHYFGYYAQNFSSSTRGVANELALASGLEFVDRREFTVRDRYGVVRLPHPTERVWLGLGWARLEIGANVSPDFASIQSAAYVPYQQRFGDEGTKSTLRRHGYAHSWGISGELEAAIGVEDVELRARARHGRYESIDGLEREQESVTRDSHGTETITDLRAHFQLEPRGTPLTSRFELAETRRTSRMRTSLGTFQAESVVRRVSIEMGVHF